MGFHDEFLLDSKEFMRLVYSYGTQQLLDMPFYGDPNAPTNLHVAPLYISDSMKQTGIPNIVTSVLASYRGYDTFGEVVVIFTAGIGVLALLGHGRNRIRPGKNRNVNLEDENRIS